MLIRPELNVPQLRPVQLNLSIVKSGAKLLYEVVCDTNAVRVRLETATPCQLETELSSLFHSLREREMRTKELGLEQTEKERMRNIVRV